MAYSDLPIGSEQKGKTVLLPRLGGSVDVGGLRVRLKATSINNASPFLDNKSVIPVGQPPLYNLAKNVVRVFPEFTSLNDISAQPDYLSVSRTEGNGDYRAFAVSRNAIGGSTDEDGYRGGFTFSQSFYTYSVVGIVPVSALPGLVADGVNPDNFVAGWINTAYESVAKARRGTQVTDIPIIPGFDNQYIVEVYDDVIVWYLNGREVLRSVYLDPGEPMMLVVSIQYATQQINNLGMDIVQPVDQGLIAAAPVLTEITIATHSLFNNSVQINFNVSATGPVEFSINGEVVETVLVNQKRGNGYTLFGVANYVAFGDDPTEFALQIKENGTGLVSDVVMVPLERLPTVTIESVVLEEDGLNYLMTFYVEQAGTYGVGFDLGIHEFISVAAGTNTYRFHINDIRDSWDGGILTPHIYRNSDVVAVSPVTMLIYESIPPVLELVSAEFFIMKVRATAAPNSVCYASFTVNGDYANAVQIGLGKTVEIDFTYEFGVVTTISCYDSYNGNESNSVVLNPFPLGM